MSHKWELYYLASLVQQKNDLNRRRRRFYSMIARRKSYLGKDANGRVMYAYWSRHKSFPTKGCAVKGYRKAQADMKAMTAHMREVRTYLNASFVWSDHGAISAVVYEGKRYDESYIKRLAMYHKAEQILLGEDV